MSYESMGLISEEQVYLVMTQSHRKNSLTDVHLQQRITHLRILKCKINRLKHMLSQWHGRCFERRLLPSSSQWLSSP